MKKLKLTFISLAALLGVATLVPSYAMAAPADQVQQGVNRIGGRGNNNLESSVRNIVNVLLFLLGMVAVIMIVIGGIRYVISGGDSAQTKAAKDTILYSVVGLVVAILAYAIVNFVVGVF